MSTNYIKEYAQIFNGGKFVRNGKEITHEEYSAFDGGGVRALIDSMLKELANRTAVTVLDWGCGTAIHWHKQTLLKSSKSIMNVLGEKVQGFYRYDPACEPYTKKPACTFDFVVCSDVLEHIPDEELEEFFFSIGSYVKKDGVIFYSISTLPSNNSFLDGENMHVNIKSPEQWFAILKKHSTGKICVVFNGKHNY